MKVIKRIEEFHNYESESVVTIGVFDGIHRGHQAIISMCVEIAHRMNLPPVVLTFDKNPACVLQKSAPCVIVSEGIKLELLEALGVDYTIILDFTKEFSSIEPEEFAKNVLSLELGARHVCVGKNFKFGNDRKGNVDFLFEIGKSLGFEVSRVPLVSSKNGVISSTLIRNLIAKGDMSSVKEALGRPYTVVGKVVEGHKRGKMLGFPTANLKLNRDFCLPAEGVYAAVTSLRGERYFSAINIGDNPTFGDNEVLFEVYIMNFEGEIYGEVIQVDFHERIRGEVKFNNPEALTRQIEKDVSRATNLLDRL
ncbi:MAG: bifunctional riboflavin kinase/FAD synthetase [Actinomycetota bacterium]|nr:bifunctional riboflavin kinase/FAD synthetase [Actinomycetota bacterium]